MIERATQDPSVEQDMDIDTPTGKLSEHMTVKRFEERQRNELVHAPKRHSTMPPVHVSFSRNMKQHSPARFSYPQTITTGQTFRPCYYCSSTGSSQTNTYESEEDEELEDDEHDDFSYLERRQSRSDQSEHVRELNDTTDMNFESNNENLTNPDNNDVSGTTEIIPAPGEVPDLSDDDHHPSRSKKKKRYRKVQQLISYQRIKASTLSFSEKLKSIPKHTKSTKQRNVNNKL